jgi:hypothetical protein
MLVAVTCLNCPSGNFLLDLEAGDEHREGVAMMFFRESADDAE